MVSEHPNDRRPVRRPSARPGPSTGLQALRWHRAWMCPTPRGSVGRVGALAAEVIEVSADHLILVLTFATVDDAQRVARDVGGPWMREHIVPRLAGDTERSVGRVIASARADASGVVAELG